MIVPRAKGKIESDGLTGLPAALLANANAPAVVSPVAAPLYKLKVAFPSGTTSF